MNRLALALSTVVLLTGCSSIDESTTLIVSPTAQDWQAAVLRLSQEEQAQLRQKAPTIVLLPSLLAPEMRSFPYGSNDNGRVIDEEKLDIRSIVASYNLTVSARKDVTWAIAATETAVNYSATEGGTQFHRFELTWVFTRLGQSRTLSARASGPGVSILWGDSYKQIAGGANQAFALSFLRLVLQLDGGTNHGL
jgi:hypothetical protein